MILWENVAYLVNDTRRTTAFEALRAKAGLTPESIAAAPRQALVEAARLGGHASGNARGPAPVQRRTGHFRIPGRSAPGL